LGQRDLEHEQSFPHPRAHGDRNMKAIFRHGDPIMVDYTPVSDVEAGDVVVVGDVPMVAHSDIAANTLGALACGGGVYDVVKDTGTSTAVFSAGKVMFWDVGDQQINEDSGNPHFGESVAAASDDDETVRVHHNPRPALS